MIDGVGLLNNTYLNALGQSDTSEKIEKTASKDLKTATDDELMNACKEFETYLVEQLYKAMRATVPKSEEESGSTSALSMFEDMLYQEYAANTTDSGQLGIAQLLYEQMKWNYTE